MPSDIRRDTSDISGVAGGPGPQGPAGVAGADGAAGVGGRVPNGYAEISANQGPGFTSSADITGLSVTVTGNSQPMMVDVFIGGYQNSIGGDGVTLRITDENNTELARWDAITPAATTSYGAATIRYAVAGFTGNKTFKVRAQQLVGGNVTIVAGSTRKAFIEVTYR